MPVLPSEEIAGKVTLLKSGGHYYRAVRCGRSVERVMMMDALASQSSRSSRASCFAIFCSAPNGAVNHSGEWMFLPSFRNYGTVVILEHVDPPDPAAGDSSYRLNDDFRVCLEKGERGNYLLKYFYLHKIIAIHLKYEDKLINLTLLLN